MKRQQVLNNSSGNDTHVRDFQNDSFRTPSSQTYQMLTGEISITQPEPLFKQNYVTVALSKGGTETTVPYPGAFIDPITGNMHGMYEGPIPGQMVMMGFQDGNSKDPFIVNRYPYQGKGNSFTEAAYLTPLTRSLTDATDIKIGHFSGSYLSFNTGILSGNLPGSVKMYSMTNFTSECLLGTTFSQDLLFEMSSASTSLKSELDGLIDDVNSALDEVKAIITSGSAVSQTVSAASQALITTAQATITARKATIATLLK